MGEKNKLLIIRFSSIGDIVLTTPLVRCLKQQKPDIEIHYLVKKNFLQVIEHNPYINKIHIFKGNLRETVNELKTENYNYIIDLQNNIRSLRIKTKLKATYATVNKINIRKWLYVNLKINTMPSVGIVDRYFATLKKLNIKNDNQGLDFFAEPDACSILDTIPPKIRKGYVVAVTGAAHFTKQIPTEIFIQILNKAHLPVVFTGSAADFEKSQNIIEQIQVQAYNACGKCTLGESSEIIKNAKVIITPDTGSMHIASAFRKPIVSLWGNTVPEFGMYPYMPNNGELSFIAQAPNLRCRPCSKIGFKKCPKKHFNCMQKQNTDEIVMKILCFWNTVK